MGCLRQEIIWIGGLVGTQFKMMEDILGGGIQSLRTIQTDNRTSQFEI